MMIELRPKGDSIGPFEAVEEVFCEAENRANITDLLTVEFVIHNSKHLSRFSQNLNLILFYAFLGLVCDIIFWSVWYVLRFQFHQANFRSHVDVIANPQYYLGGDAVPAIILIPEKYK